VIRGVDWHPAGVDRAFRPLTPRTDREGVKMTIALCSSGSSPHWLRSRVALATPPTAARVGLSNNPREPEARAGRRRAETRAEQFRLTP
jgi:hypothetical protein